MPFREKTAWLSLIGIVAAFGWYFGSLAFHFGPAAALPAYSLSLLAPTIILLMVVTVIGAVAMAIHRPQDADGPADERDRAIVRRAASSAYAVVIPAVIVAISLPLFGIAMTIVLNAVIGAIVLAEIVRCSMEIAGYRRGG